MNNFKGNVINEIQKLFLKKKIMVFLIIMAIVSFLPAFFFSAIKAKLMFIAFDSISYSQMILSIMTNIFLPLFIFMVTSEIFSGEVADKTMKLVLSRPISRFKVFLSKNIAIGIYVVINLIVILIVSIIASVFLKFNMDNIGQTILGYIIDIIPALILVLFTSLIAQFFKSSSGVLVSSILIFMGIKVLALFISGLNNISFTSHLNWYSELLSSGKILSSVNLMVMLLAYGLIFFTAGFYLFDKKEF
ncbi:ABC transporter permease [Clostridium gasigenes]|uniref:ABC transporter permease n=1 Tax=Clostridium gasigenes TaxID=94869 RepID=UPI001C0CC91D|nr:ABC transporter permease [Clostridium gasigenes]